ncbi:ligand-binding sensor domain-containing protein [Litorilituus lipolyticus]|uniref:Diguanylate cyclase n=1 Tax=Litorilituus lipolyticus TaxID=2491017 RepID=A0A502KM53_9GAMM|nr:two-component regulator propeller domain-containing protein [Litorilituus lipolyticus]TPH12556.1 diguanylate cyclase [Litorilituus lipolyticus]
MKKIFIFLLLCNQSLFAQEIKLFKRFNVDNPMSYLFVRTLAQDKDGFMWIGSQEGLHRFDGYQYLSFHHDANLASSLSSNVVSSILINKRNELWVGTRGGGLNLYQEKTQDFLHFSTKSKSLPLSNDSVNTLYETSDGKLWVGTDNGVNIIYQNQGKWHVKKIQQEIGQVNSLSHNTVHAITETDSKQVLVGTNGGGVSIFDENGDFLRTLTYQQQGKKLINAQFINALYSDKQGFIWVGTVDHGLIKYNPRDRSHNHYVFNENDSHSLISNTIEDIFQDSSGQIWIATDKGALTYNNLNDNFYRYNHSPTNPYSLSNDFTLTFFEDSNNLMWIGTMTGVNRWDANMTTFKQYSVQTHPQLQNDNITSFAQDNESSIIFSTYSGGIYRLSLADNQVSRMNFNGYFSELRIMTLFQEGHNLWVGTRSSGLFKIDLKSKAIKKYSHKENDQSSISANSITDILKDNNGNVWVSTFHQGLNKLNADGSFTRYTQDKENMELGPSSNHILHLLQGKEGNLWLATYGGGLSQLDLNTLKFTHLRHDEAKVGSISSDLSWFMYQDKEANLWAGTQAAGLNILKQQDIINNRLSFQYLDTKDGMKSRTVYGISQDPNGYLWFSTNKGISRFDTKSRRFKHFGLSHGLIDLDFNHGSIFSSMNETIYFGAGKSFVSVNPSDIDGSRQAPEVRLTNILNLNEPMTFNERLSDISSITFGYKDQVISFEYVGLNYANPESTRYKYRLLGFDQEWVNADKLRRATYTNLPQGNYQLQIIAGNSDDVWSKPYQLNVVMNPAPWNTWWAYLIYVSIIAFIILMYSRLLNRKLLLEQQQKLLLEKQVEEKTQEYLLKNTELEHANKQLEKAATIDKITGVKSRRYLDIYIEQASQLMNNIHQNLLPVQRNILPRLYIIMIKIDQLNNVTNSQLVNLTDLLLYSRNPDDLVIRWSTDTFAIIGYEKENNAAELSTRLTKRLEDIFEKQTTVSMAFSFYPFNREQPVDISWDQVNVIIEMGLNIVQQDSSLSWLGFCEPKEQPFNYMDVLKVNKVNELKQHILIKQG